MNTVDIDNTGSLRRDNAGVYSPSWPYEKPEVNALPLAQIIQGDTGSQYDSATWTVSLPGNE